MIMIVIMIMIMKERIRIIRSSVIIHIGVCIKYYKIILIPLKILPHQRTPVVT